MRYVTPAQQTPVWVRDALFYQIFPERFANGNPSISPAHVQPWGSPPLHGNFMGGDLRGITERLGYLADLGVTALYLNPIFQATSNHKYNTFDYFRVDPHFGDLATFRALLSAAHARGIRVVLDGVFNHCGRGFYAFHDLLENGSASAYRDWFHVQGFPLRPYDETKPANYACWWDIRSLPKFNTTHPPVRAFLLDVARYWIDQGADGWRLDVPNEIDDHAFWREFRQVVKAANPDAYIVGEIWEDATPWLDGTQFDAVMNYPFRDLCRDFFAHASLSATDFASGISSLLQRYPRAHTEVQLNLLGSHDTARFCHEADNAVARLFPAFLFQMTFPGAPCIYYGDEIGLTSAGDPHCRACFPWDATAWNTELHAWTKRCIALRHAHPALRTGELRVLLAADTTRTVAFGRWDDAQQLVVVLNPQAEPLVIDLPVGTLPQPVGSQMHDLLSGATYAVERGVVRNLHVANWRGAVLVSA